MIPHQVVARASCIAYDARMAARLHSDLGRSPAEVENRMRKALRLALAVQAAGGTPAELDPLLSPPETVDAVKANALRAAGYEHTTDATWLAARDLLAELGIWQRVGAR
jgi:hypothetical protein